MWRKTKFKFKFVNNARHPNLKPNKASGPDNIGPRVLKELADIIADPLTRIFRRSLQDGQVPQDWKHARVAPIFKKAKNTIQPTTRPISLTCLTSKLMENIICSNLMEHASQNNILYSLQHGFRERRSCEMQFIEFVHDVVSSMQDSLQTDVCVLDFSKAFDKVGHQRLLHKLRVVRRQRHHKPVDPKLPWGQDTVGCCWRGRVGQSDSSVRGTPGVRLGPVPLPVLHQRHRPGSHLHHQAI